MSVWSQLTRQARRLLLSRDRPPGEQPPQSAAPALPDSALVALDAFLAAQFREATLEDVQRVGGLNGQLSVARLLILRPALLRGAADVLVVMAALDHRLHHLTEDVERYRAQVGLKRQEMPVFRLIDAASPAMPPLRRARELYEAALAVDPGHALAAFNLATLRELTGEAGAAELYRLAGERDGFLRPHAALRRAALEENAERWDEAAALYVEADAGLKRLGPWHENAARCLRRCGRVAEALQHYERALDWTRQPGPEFIIHPPEPHSETYAGTLPPLLRRLLAPVHRA